MNYSDAERISALLKKYKLKKASSADEANLIVFVTCGVRQSAEDRVYGQINNLRKKYPKKKIILTGCLAHRKDVQKRLSDKINFFLPMRDICKIHELILRKFPISNNQFPNKFQNPNYQLPITNYLKINPLYKSKYTAYVPIMTGCNNFCAYCVVPYARGREYSRPVEDILREVRGLIKKGYKEIILLGQNVNSYRGTDKNSSSEALAKEDKYINFSELLQLIERIPGNFWITFLTSHPKDMSDELVETIAKSKKICEYISLPAQSGDNEILRKMNRHYTVLQYKNLIKKIRQKLSFGELRAKASKEKSLALGNTFKKLPPSISTDIIVGFPGETKKQFENTSKLLREMKFDMVYISQYSPALKPPLGNWKIMSQKKKKPAAKKSSPKFSKKPRLKTTKNILAKLLKFW